MSERVRHLLPKRWREALRLDADLAQAEGLAAGTGLLTGDVARSSVRPAPAESTCPECRGSAEVVVVDLVDHATTLRCTTCGHGWTAPLAPGSRTHH